MSNPAGEHIVEPREVDVLCGRGGMSNHHPGNEWYRRLIRSNRPLYRACPKHTKLLVSKAIVQAVEQQGGRFLERNRKNGYWYTVSYKRAVDKTSQGLRERDRDDDNNSGGGSTGGGGEGGADNNQKDLNVQVPEPFSGRRTGKDGPNLSDLAEVAIAHANRSGGVAPGGGGASRAPSFSGAASTNGMTTVMNLNQKRSNGMIGAFNDGNNNVDNLNLMNQNKRARMDGNSMMNTMNRGNFGPGGVGETTLTGEDDMPLPPTLEPRQSSMFRLLSQTHLLSSQTSTLGSIGMGNNGGGQQSMGMMPGQPLLQQNTRSKSYPTKLNNLQIEKMQQQPMRKQQFQPTQNQQQQQFQQQMQGLLGNTVNTASAPQPNDIMQASSSIYMPYNVYGNNNSRNQSQQFNTNNNMLLQQQQPQILGSSSFGVSFGRNAQLQGNLNAGNNNGSGSNSADADSAPPPPLARLTSQVSDWLTSFWPLSSNRAQAQQPVQPSIFDTTPGDNVSSVNAGPTTNNESFAPFQQQPQQQQSFGMQQMQNVTTGGGNMPGSALYPRSRLPDAIQKQLKIPAPVNTSLAITTVPPPANKRHDDGMTGSQDDEQFGGVGRRGSGIKRKGRTMMPPLPYAGGLAANQMHQGQVIASGQLQAPNLQQLNSSNMQPSPRYGKTSSRSMLDDDDYDDSNNNIGQGSMAMTSSKATELKPASRVPIGIPEPTELEQSVSTTLLKLAGSSIISGFTSFFERGGGELPAQSMDDDDDIPGTTNGGGEMQRNPSKSRGGLLDDYEETPAEADVRRLSSSGSHHSSSSAKKSLLDDYEESPLEAQMRAV